MSAEWYYGRDGKHSGPVTEDDLKQLAASDKLLPSDLVWKDGMAEWAAAETVDGLFPTPTSPKPPPMKPPPAMPLTGEPPSDTVTGATPDPAKQLVGGVKKAFGWYSENLGFGKLANDQKVVALCGLWETDIPDSPTLQITADGPTGFLKSVNDKITVLRSDGFCTKAEFNPKEMTLLLKPDNLDPVTLRVMSLTSDELVLASDEGTIHYKRGTTFTEQKRKERMTQAASTAAGLLGLFAGTALGAAGNAAVSGGVSGGGGDSRAVHKPSKCPKCGSTVLSHQESFSGKSYQWVCQNCLHRF